MSPIITSQDVDLVTQQGNNEPKQKRNGKNMVSMRQFNSVQPSPLLSPKGSFTERKMSNLISPRNFAISPRDSTEMNSGIGKTFLAEVPSLNYRQMRLFFEEQNKRLSPTRSPLSKTSETFSQVRLPVSPNPRESTFKLPNVASVKAVINTNSQQKELHPNM